MKEFWKTIGLTGVGIGALSLAVFVSGCDGRCPLSGCAKPAAASRQPDQPSTDGGNWMTNFELAQSQAKINNKPLLLSFSGSDWCGWCIKLEKEVFAQPEFENWAKENVVLFNADFPRKTAQDPAEQAQNEALAAKYRVTGFPTVILLNAQGEEIGRTGYQSGGAAAYIEHLKQLIR